jgi:hypothetical protein
MNWETKKNYNLFESFNRVRDMAFDNMVLIRKYHKIDDQMQKILPLQRFLEECCTLKLYLGRQTGCTTWIVNKAKSLTKSNNKSIIIIPNYHILNSIISRFNFNIKGIVFTINSVHAGYIDDLQGQDLDYIFIDNSEYLNDKQINDIYLFGSLHKVKNIILM